MSDAVADGRNSCALTLVDACTREGLAIEVDVSLPGERVVRALEQLRKTRGLSERITVDNGPGFQSNALDAWAHHRAVHLHFSRPGKLVDNTFIEAFNGRMRDECLNQSWFLSLPDARRTIAARRERYHTARPHRGLQGRTPNAYAADQRALVTPTGLSLWKRT